MRAATTATVVTRISMSMPDDSADIRLYRVDNSIWMEIREASTGPSPTVINGHPCKVGEKIELGETVDVNGWTYWVADIIDVLDDKANQMEDGSVTAYLTGHEVFPTSR